MTSIFIPSLKYGSAMSPVSSIIPLSNKEAVILIISLPGTAALAPPSKAGPAAVAVTTILSPLTIAISPFVPKSIKRIAVFWITVLGIAVLCCTGDELSSNLQWYSPAAISPPTKVLIPGVM